MHFESRYFITMLWQTRRTIIVTRNAVNSGYLTSQLGQVNAANGIILEHLSLFFLHDDEDRKMGQFKAYYFISNQELPKLFSVQLKLIIDPKRI